MTVPIDDSRRLSAAVDLVLGRAGWRRITGVVVADWPDGCAAYEDPYSVVGVATFASITELLSEWVKAQARLAELIATTVVDIRQKAWDGYLLLVTPARSSPHATGALTEIRSNTRRLRKLVVTGDDLALAATEPELISSVRSNLAPLLPLDLEAVAGPVDPLADLPRRIARRGVDHRHIDTILQAREAGLPLVAALHAARADMNTDAGGSQ